MKAKDFILELQKLDPETEIGFNHQDYFDRFLSIHVAYVDGNYIEYNAYPKLDFVSNEESVKVVILTGSISDL